MSEQAQGARFFTLARRIPTLFGRLHDGTRIPGGPYTVTQVVAAVTTAVVLSQTTALWARFGILGNPVVFIALVAGIGFVVKFLPSGGRNPFAWVLGVLSLTFRRRGGRRRGVAVQVNRARRVRHTFNVLPDAPAPRA